MYVLFDVNDESKMVNMSVSVKSMEYKTVPLDKIEYLSCQLKETNKDMGQPP